MTLGRADIKAAQLSSAKILHSVDIDGARTSGDQTAASIGIPKPKK